MEPRKTLLLAGCVGLSLILLVGCGDDDDGPITPPAPSGASQTIGAAGGNLEISDELTLTVPANALAKK